jgi:DNA-binding MarR family transcriptional regulator
MPGGAFWYPARLSYHLFGWTSMEFFPAGPHLNFKDLDCSTADIVNLCILINKRAMPPYSGTTGAARPQMHKILCYRVWPHRRPGVKKILTRGKILVNHCVLFFTRADAVIMNGLEMNKIPRCKAEATDFDRLSYQVYLNLQKIFRCLNIGRGLQGKRLPITMTQMRVLSLFNERDCISISDISRSLGMSLQSVTNLVCRLEQLDYLERTKNQKDKRVSDVRLTAKGRKRQDMFRSGEIETVRLLLERLNTVEGRVLNETLNGIALLFEKASTTSS